MYTVDTSSLWAYIGSMFRLVGGALALDPVLFRAAFNYTGPPVWILFWIAFVAGLSHMVGQSVVLFANRLKPPRFVITLFLGAIGFVLEVLLVVVVVWAMANLLGEQYWGMLQIARAIALASAPYWLSFLVLLPIVGIFVERALRVYVWLAVYVALQASFDLTFFEAVLAGTVALLIAMGIRTLIGRLFTPIADWLVDKWVGHEAIADAHKIYELFAARNQIAE